MKMWTSRTRRASRRDGSSERVRGVSWPTFSGCGTSPQCQFAQNGHEPRSLRDKVQADRHVVIHEVHAEFFVELPGTVNDVPLRAVDVEMSFGSERAVIF